MSNTSPPIHNRIAVLRAERKVSRLALAEALNINYQTIGFLERGDYNPSLALAMDLADFFHLPIEAIFSRQPLAPPQPPRLPQKGAGLMIEQTTFLGFPLAPLRNRRMLVVAFYAVSLGLTLLAILYPRLFTTVLFTQTATLGGVLGGIRSGGPVKVFHEKPADPNRPIPDGSGIQQLNLAGRPRFNLLTPLDERDRTERDHAHYVAFRILYLVLAGLTLAFWIANELNLRAAIYAAAPMLCWTILILASTLPQSVILWTEPEPQPDQELALAR